MNTHKLNNKHSWTYRSARAVLFSKPILTSAAILAALPMVGRADDDCCTDSRDLNSLSFSARFGFNIGARFKNSGHIAFVNNRKTPDGLNFNYDDGYVRTDSSGDAGGYTYNWGFDSARQVSPPATPDNHLALSRTTSADGMSSPWKDADVSLGGELVYRHEFGQFLNMHNMRWGIEAAGNFANINVNDHASYGGTVTRMTDTFVPFPGAMITGPRQGTADGPGTLLNDTPISSGMTTGAAAISGVRKIDADMWGFRVGPYLEMPLSQKVNLSLSGGFAGAWLDVGASWRETLAVGMTQYPFSGSGSDHQFRFGGYVAANAEYQFAHDWSLVGGAQFQSLQNYDQSISGRRVQMDLSNAIFVTLGLSYRF
jgi:hypothetical protein